jgi:hypothetical protein
MIPIAFYCRTAAMGQQDKTPLSLAKAEFRLTDEALLGKPSSRKNVVSLMNTRPYLSLPAEFLPTSGILSLL